jgi:hypothetical protein
MKKMVMASIMVLAVMAMVGVAAADLPDSAKATIDYLGPSTSAPGYWGVQVTEQTPADGDLVIGAPYVGWCADAQHSIADGSHIFTVYSSLEDLSGAPSVISGSDWNKINYIINHKEIGNNNMQAIQAAIWQFDGGIPISWAYFRNNHPVEFNALVDAANANPDYVPGPGDVYAVILYKPCSQVIIIEVPIPIPSPEFPTLAVPAGLLVGIIGVVAVIRARQSEA